MFMGSFNSSHHQTILPQQQQQDDQQQQDPHYSSDLQQQHQHQYQQHQQIIAHQPEPPLLMSRGLATSLQLLISCAEFISHRDFSSARRLISVLSSSSYSSPHGDSTERLVHQFVRALSLRLPPNDDVISTNTSAAAAASTSSAEEEGEEEEEEALQSCYLTLNQVTPFIRFCHLTANQAILEAIDSSHHAIHILDFDIKHGVQWPPLMQALAERSSSSSSSSSSLQQQPHLPTLRITATGRDLTLLHRTGERLLLFAQSLGLTFHFRPILLLNDVALIDYLNPASLGLFSHEALAVNCVLYLHRLLLLPTDDLRRLFLNKIKSLNPKIVTVAEREADHNSPVFLHRFAEAVDHYGAVFSSLEATLPPNSRERLAVEQVWFGREIADVVADDDDNDNDDQIITPSRIRNNRRRRRKQLRHERYEKWVMMLRRSGFSNVPLSPFALSQAKLLLRLHYPSEGYQLHGLNGSIFLGWINRPLFSVSSWN